MNLLIADLIQNRVPDYTAYTYQEINDRVPVRLAPHRAPEPPRQAEIAPIKRAEQQIAFFYHLPFMGGSLIRANLNGWHTVIQRIGGVPRGRLMTPVGERVITRRRRVVSYGSTIPEV